LEIGEKNCERIKCKFKIWFCFKGGKILPKGATLVISTFNVQRNPDYWGHDANKFRPERFEPENFLKVPPYAYIPFTGGPRICIGWRYGMLFTKTCLVNFLRNFEATTSLKFEELKYEVSLSMKIVQGCRVSIRKRGYWTEELVSNLFESSNRLKKI
jgi:cytochrome P450